MSNGNRIEARRHRHRRIRRKISGTAELPRLAIMVSRRRIYVQLVDDFNGTTVMSMQTGRDEGHNVSAAKSMGERLAKALREKGIGRVVVDRGGFKFHGRVKALVDAVEGGGVAKLSPNKKPRKKKERSADKAKPSESKKKAKEPKRTSSEKTDKEAK